MLLCSVQVITHCLFKLCDFVCFISETNKKLHKLQQLASSGKTSIFLPEHFFSEGVKILDRLLQPNEFDDRLDGVGRSDLLDLVCLRNVAHFEQEVFNVRFRKQMRTWNSMTRF